MGMAIKGVFAFGSLGTLAFTLGVKIDFYRYGYTFMFVVYSYVHFVVVCRTQRLDVTVLTMFYILRVVAISFDSS
jgi:hypothetical protein